MRLFLIPLLFVLLSGLIGLVLGNQFEIPGSYAEAITWLRSFGRWAWAVAMAVIIGDFLLPLPSTPALASLGIIYGPLLGGLIGGVATTAAGLLAFGLTRALGRRGALYLVGEQDLARAQHFYDRWGIYAVTLGRAIGGPLEWLVLIAGISGMPFARALVAILVGGFSAAFVTAWLGDLAADRPALAITLVLVFAIALAGLARRLLAAERHTPSRRRQVQFSITTEVDAPPDVVFAVLSEVERWHEWTPTVTRVERLGDAGAPLALGGRLRIVQPKVPPAEWTVTALEPGRGFRLLSRSPGATVEADHWAEPTEAGHRSRATLSVTFAGFLGRIIGWMMSGLNKRYLAQEMAGLKSRSEERARGTE